jgi:hypothetical protein
MNTALRAFVQRKMRAYFVLRGRKHASNSTKIATTVGRVDFVVRPMHFVAKAFVTAHPDKRSATALVSMWIPTNTAGLVGMLAKAG